MRISDWSSDVCSADLDLTLPPLDRDRSIWTDPAAYGPCQDLADAARGAGVEAIVYESVRDPERRRNLAVLRPEALGRGRQVTAQQTWWIHMTPKSSPASASSRRRACHIAGRISKTRRSPADSRLQPAPIGTPLHLHPLPPRDPETRRKGKSGTG